MADIADFPYTPLTLGRAVANARAEFARVYKRLGTTVFTQALHVLESCDEAEEATSEVFAALWHEWPGSRLIGEEALRSLALVATARTLVRHHAPEHGRESQLPWVASPKDTESGRRMPAAHGTVAEITAAVARSRPRLSAEDQAIIEQTFARESGPAPDAPKPAFPLTMIRRALHRLNREVGAELRSGGEGKMKADRDQKVAASAAPVSFILVAAPT